MNTTLVGLDSEDDGAGTPLLFAIVHRRGTFWTESRHRMLEHLARRAESAPLEIWCTNLEYDLLNLFGVERLAELHLRFGKSFLVGARWRGRKIEFRDTLRHVPASVEQLGELVGKPKLEATLFEKGRQASKAELLRRCLRDASITFQVAKRLHQLYAEVGGRPRQTLASSAYHVWFDRFWKREIHRPEQEQWQAAFEAYFGGRTEPFAVGTFEQVRAIDAVSMFPWAMTVKPFPVPWGSFRRHVPGSEDLDPNGFYRAHVRSNLERPLLPYRSRDGLVFPNGAWVGWYVGSELQAFGAAGGRLDILEGFSYSTSVRPFDGYIRTMFQRKSRSQGARRLFYKLMLNALYGKFGQRGERVVAVPLERFRKMERAPLNFRIWADLAFYSEKHEPPPWGNQVWPAIVTARARERLWHELQRIEARSGKVLYCDTDGVLFQQGRIRYPSSAAEPGSFENRGTFPVAMIRAKKEYALQHPNRRWQFFSKGVPVAAREEYLYTGEVSFERPVKLREAARTGEQPNIWRAVRKVRRVSFEKRRRRRDGTLAPLEVQGDTVA